MSDPAVDLSIPIKPIGPFGPPLMPPLRAELPSSTSSVVGLEVERRTMIVGAQVSVSADIRFCDRLVVAGSLEASLHECRECEVAVGGSFKGNATAGTVDIRGRFAGDLVAHEGVVIHSTAYVSGSITYGEIEIKSGAQIAAILMPDKRTDKSSIPPAFAIRRA